MTTNIDKYLTNPEHDARNHAGVTGVGDLTTAAHATLDHTGIPGASAAVPAGTILDYAGAVVPGGYLDCDGAAVSRATYATLYTALGAGASPWGQGDLATTFNVPDLRRRTTVGSGGVGTGVLANTVGATGGTETHTLVTGEIPAHPHNITANLQAQVNTQSTAASGSGANLMTSAAANGTQVIGMSTPQALGGGTWSTASAGGGSAHNNVQPSAVVRKIIKT